MFNLTSLDDFDKIFPDEVSCIKYLKHRRWRGKIQCVHCNSEKVYELKDHKLLKCASCNRNFRVTTGTIYEGSNLPLRKWFLATYMLTSRKKGISSIQLSKDLKITQKSAWVLLQKLRHVLNNQQNLKPLKGVVECDETYVGGKRKFSKRGRGAEHKTPVFGMVERNGKLRVMPVARCNAATLKPIINQNVSKNASVMTDEWPAYRGLSKNYRHAVVNHRRKEYVNGDCHTNTIEGFWSHLKRGVKGTYHHVSRKHLLLYCKEFEHRYNTRNMTDPERFESVFSQSAIRVRNTEV